MIHPVLSVVLFVILGWQVVMLVVSWRLGVTNFGGVRFERHERPRIYWSLYSLHAVLTVTVALVLADIAFGMRP